MIKTEYGTFDGDKWEQVCKICFYRMYDSNDDVYTHIEATPGDDGLEGFTKSGKAFQCYCPDKIYSADQLYKKHTIKINSDLNKLKLNEVRIKQHLGDIKIKTWYLVTPEISKKDIIAYCNKKTFEVRNWNLSIIDNVTFKVVAVDISFILPFLNAALGGLNLKTQYNLPIISSPEDIMNYKNNGSYLIDNAVNKHTKNLSQKGVDTQKNIDFMTHKTIAHYLDGNKVLELWRKDSIKDYEKFRKIISQEEEEITEICFFPNESYNQRYEEIKKRTELKISQTFSYLDETTIKDLANYVISDWLLRCPLNFV